MLEASDKECKEYFGNFVIFNSLMPLWSIYLLLWRENPSSMKKSGYLRKTVFMEPLATQSYKKYGPSVVGRRECWLRTAISAAEQGLQIALKSWPYLFWSNASSEIR